MGWGYAIATEAQSVRKTPGRLRSRAWALVKMIGLPLPATA
jgi:hypothetical protein